MTVPGQIAPADRGSVAVAGGEIHYTVSGKGPPLVFAHGLGGNLNSWWQQVPVFSEAFTCIAFNHRGFLPSYDETGVPRPAFYGRDLLALLDHLKIARTVIIGQSMGGWTAMELWLIAPERVGGLVLSGTTGTLSHPRIATMVETGQSDEIRRCHEEGIMPSAGRRIAREQPELYQMYLGIDRQSGDWSRASVRGALDAMRIREPALFASMDFPVQAIVGAEDPVCPPANVEVMAEVLPDVSVAVVPEAGHSVYFERAAAFNEITRDYLLRIKAYQ